MNRSWLGTGRGLVVCVAGAAVLTLGACQSETTSGLVLQPGESARITTLGSNPYVEIRNDGPAWLEDARWNVQGGTSGSGKIGPGGAVGRTMAGGGSIEVTAAPDGRANVFVTARKSKGMAVEAPWRRASEN